jgi:DNA-binding GntR family transcriptional regulator
MVAKITKLERDRPRPKDGKGPASPVVVAPGKANHSLSRQAYELLKEAILRLELKPGDMSTDSALSRMLGMSRTPVREALTLLEREHLVRRLPNQGGVLIRELSMDDIVHILHMREALDGLAAKLAADKIDPKLLAEIESDFKAMHELSGEEAANTHRMLSHRLHSAILEAAANPFLSATSEELSGSFERMRNYNWRVWNASKNSVRINERRYREHLQIIDALKARDPRRAEKAARAHIVSGLEDMLMSKMSGR